MGDVTRPSESFGQSYPTRRQLRFKIEYAKALILAKRYKKVQRAVSLNSVDQENKALGLEQHYHDLLEEREQGFRVASLASVPEKKEGGAGEENVKLRWRHLTEKFLVAMERKVKEAGLKDRGPDVGSSQHAQDVWRGKTMNQQGKDATAVSSASGQTLPTREHDTKVLSSDTDNSEAKDAPVATNQLKVRHSTKQKAGSSPRIRKILEKGSPTIRYEPRDYMRLRRVRSDAPKAAAEKLGMRRDEFEEMRGAWGQLKAEDWDDGDFDDEGNSRISDEAREQSKLEMLEGVRGMVKRQRGGG